MEIEDRLKAVECTSALIEKICKLSQSYAYESWKESLIIITVTLILTSPETLHAKHRVKQGVVRKLSNALKVSPAAISNRIEQVRHYYGKVSWTRDVVDKIVKEIKGNGESDASIP